MADEETFSLEQAETHGELEERQGKVEELIRFLPPDQRKARKSFLAQKQKMLASKLAEEERRM